MAGKKVKNEVESIRNELLNLSEAVWALRELVTVQSAVAAARTPGTSSRSSTASGSRSGLSIDGDGQGSIVSQGVVRDANGAREYRWDLETNTTNLLAIDDETAAQLLAAIGHPQRLAILKTILDTPTSASDLVERLDLGTTGAAYHHLKVLQAADVVTTESRGVFVVQPYRVSAIFSILAGIESASTVSINGAADTDNSAADGPEVTGGKRKKR
jgi:DNA-binding transcriptional ArsR family regulator